MREAIGVTPEPVTGITSVKYGVKGVDRIITAVDLEGVYTIGGYSASINALFISRDGREWELDPRRVHHVAPMAGYGPSVQTTVERTLLQMLPLPTRNPRVGYQQPLYDAARRDEQDEVPAFINVQEEKEIGIGSQWTGNYTLEGKRGEFKLEMKDPESYECPIRGLDIDVTAFFEDKRLPEIEILLKVMQGLIGVIQEGLEHRIG